MVRGCSSDGRALQSHCRGQGFESPQLHQSAPPKALNEPVNRKSSAGLSPFSLFMCLRIVPAVLHVRAHGVERVAIEAPEDRIRVLPSEKEIVALGDDRRVGTEEPVRLADAELPASTWRKSHHETRPVDAALSPGPGRASGHDRSVRESVQCRTSSERTATTF